MNKAVVAIASFTVFFLFFSCKREEVSQVNIIPRPTSVVTTKDNFRVSSKTRIVVDGREGFKAGRLLAEYLYFLEEPEPVPTGNILAEDGSSVIRFVYDSAGLAQNEEGYKLEISNDAVTITAGSEAGFVHAVFTVLQLIPASLFDTAFNLSEVELPGVVISDAPRFSYRGMHLDVCRHFFPVSFIKKYIDLLAFYKFNTFHWHLTEDQGWRIEIKKYPELTRVGAWRDSTLVGHSGDKPKVWDGKKYGGYYSQDEIKEVVSYAADRCITIIPEIEMPGHSLAALSAYPEYSCTGGPFRPATQWGVFEDVYCPKEETFTFLEDVLTEVMELFPGEYIHIGGDECPKTRWKNCSHCQALIRKEGLAGEEELQSYFIRRIESFLNKHGRKLIGWDEILEGGLSPNATVMSWRGTRGGIEAAKQFHHVIMTPGEYCYFDHYQDDPETQPLAIGGLTTLEKVYSYEPIPKELSTREAEYILGAQANVWTEYLATPKDVEYMILPRMAALAEVLWSDPADRNWKDFTGRIQHHFPVYDAMKLNYYSVVETHEYK